MTKQERFNAIMDAIKAIGNAERCRYTDIAKADRERDRADEALRRILHEDWGDWGDMSNPKIVKLWENYDRHEEELKRDGRL